MHNICRGGVNCEHSSEFCCDETENDKGNSSTTNFSMRRDFTALAAAAAVAMSSFGNPFHPPKATAITSNNLLFLEAWRAVDKAYVDKTFNGITWFKYREDTIKKVPMDSKDETYAAIRNMLLKLEDPFTRFLEPEKYATLLETTLSANITGIGVELAYGGSDGKQIVVVAPAPESPADKAEIKPADIISAIDGESTQGLTVYEVANRLQGPVNSEVELALAREGELGSGHTVERKVVLLRQTYPLVPVQSMLCMPTEATGKAVSYIKLTTFNQLAGTKLKEAVLQGVQGGADAFVLDLRSNSGGLFPAALDIAKLFMNDGVIVYIADSGGVRDVFEADNTAIAPNVPLTLLVDRGTASASEVLAGSLRDNNRARILGETTFGKGLIQTVVPLSDGSAISVTVARYQTPAGKDINKVGITPDAPLPTVFVSDDHSEIRGQLPATAERFCSILATDVGIAAQLFPE